MDNMLDEIISAIEKYGRKVAENFDYLDKNIDMSNVKTIDDILDKICDYEETYEAFIDAMYIINIIANAFVEASINVHWITEDHLNLMVSPADDEVKKDKAYRMLNLIDIVSEMKSALALFES